jgi:hypothetical protein
MALSEVPKIAESICFPADIRGELGSVELLARSDHETSRDSAGIRSIIPLSASGF